MLDKTQTFITLVSAPDREIASLLIRSALKGHLAACANLLPQIESHYWWKGSLESSSECLIIFKSSEAQLTNLKKLILKDHPYEVPEFISFPIHSGSKTYIDWIIGECSIPKNHPNPIS